MGIFSIKPRQLPSRIAAGAFILNSGIGKLSADEATAAYLHGFAAGAYPFLSKIKPKDFARFLAVSEVALGAVIQQGLRAAHETFQFAEKGAVLTVKWCRRSPRLAAGRSRST